MSSRGSYDDHKHKRTHKYRSRSRSPKQEDEHRRHRHKHIKKERHDGGYARERSPSPDDHHRHSHQHIKREHIKREHDDHHHRRPMKQERGDRGPERDSRRGDDRERRQHNRRREAHRAEQDNEDWGATGQEDDQPPPDKEKPNFGLSGKLTEETNTFKGVVIKYNEPPEARKPRRKWRLYPFKGDESLPVMHMHRQSAYLFGRQRKIADIPVDHPSCSKQHAVFQYRMVDFKKADGRMGKKIQPYIIDLESANGTYVNNSRIEPQRYVELFEKDVVKFGFSSREYVLLHEGVDTSEVAPSEESDGSD